MQISLRPITRENYQEVCRLKVRQEQEDLLASNIESLVEASFNSEYVTRGIYLDEKTVVGFLMWVPNTEENPIEVSIWRFMVDQAYQNKGIGRTALQLAINEIRETESLIKLTVCYWPRNTVSKELYASVGFIEVGLDELGEVIAEIEFDKT